MIDLSREVLDGMYPLSDKDVALCLQDLQNQITALRDRLQSTLDVNELWDGS